MLNSRSARAADAGDQRGSAPPLPKGSEDGGTWGVGDLAFGGVMIVLGTNDTLFMQPLGLAEVTQGREQSDAARIARAEQAGITKLIEK